MELSLRTYHQGKRSCLTKGAHLSDLSQHSLESLVRLLQQGESGALEPFIEKTQTAAYRLALSYLKDEHAAQDALQEAYLLVYRRARQLHDPSAVKGWFFQIVRSCCHRVLRKRRPEDPLEELEGPNPDPVASRSVDRLSIETTFAQLKEQDRTVLTLREVWQLSYDEIASTLEIPVGTVRSRLAGARKKFLKIFRGEKS